MLASRSTYSPFVANRNHFISQIVCEYHEHCLHTHAATEYHQLSRRRQQSHCRTSSWNCRRRRRSGTLCAYASLYSCEWWSDVNSKFVLQINNFEVATGNVFSLAQNWQQRYYVLRHKVYLCAHCAIWSIKFECTFYCHQKQNFTFARKAQSRATKNGRVVNIWRRSLYRITFATGLIIWKTETWAKWFKMVGTVWITFITHASIQIINEKKENCATKCKLNCCENGEVILNGCSNSVQS